MTMVRASVVALLVSVTCDVRADFPSAQPLGALAPPSATFTGGVTPASGNPTIPRTAYDDQRQSVFILDGPATPPVMPLGTPSFNSSGTSPSGIYQAVTGGLTGPTAATQAIYQPPQQFQLLDTPGQKATVTQLTYNTIEAPSLPPGAVVPDCYDDSCQPWTWQILPSGLIWHSYLAGPREPRIGGELVSDTGVDTKLDGSVGGRAGLLRFGNTADYRPQGWQADVEGGAIIRQDLTQNSDVDAYDFRIGFPLTYAWGDYQMKIAWYHTSAHLGDEFMLKHPDFTRINYSRNAIVWGHSYYLTPDLRFYGEVEWAYFVDGGSRPWAFHFGMEYNPVVRGWHGSPFFDINAYLRQENDWGGPLTVETGWQWRPLHGGQLIRTGFFYQTGPSAYGQFFDDSEQLIGYGLWYDF